MKCFKLGLVAMAMMLCGSAQAKVDLKIVRGEVDTVYNKTHYVVGVTNVGNRAYVNGDRVHVYKTGSFAAAVELKEGPNTISVIVDDTMGEVEKILNVYYSTNRPEKLFTSRQAKKELQRSKMKKRDFNAVSKKGAYLQYGDGDDR